MSALPVILIVDVGKTNKKLLLFDRQYRLVHEEAVQLEETKDEDGFQCEDVHALTQWMKDSIQRLRSNQKFDIKAVNFTAYGASFVYLDDQRKAFLPLYNYLKPFSDVLLEQFYNTYGGKSEFARRTASPVLGNLNSGMQLYRLKYEKPEVFKKIKVALHLPQYLCFVLTQEIFTDITSLGSHTNLWDFTTSKYHDWVSKEGLMEKFAPLKPSNECIEKEPVGIGLHDSSAALIPYILSFSEPFVLISTGTWCITLNPFNHTPLTNEELEQDCLCYLGFQGKPVKASRLFAGYDHEQQTKRIADHFNVDDDYFTTVEYTLETTRKLTQEIQDEVAVRKASKHLPSFNDRSLSEFATYEEAYQALLMDIVVRQCISTDLVLTKNTRRIFVDGGFSKNSLYMNLLAAAFPEMEIFAASVAQASALGAALAIHRYWNDKPISSTLIDLKHYATIDYNLK